MQRILYPGFLAAIAALQILTARAQLPATVVTVVSTVGQDTAPVSAAAASTPAVHTDIHDPAWNGSASLSALPTPNAARLVNLSARSGVGAASATLIAGAGIAGDGKVPVLVRAIGPGLRSFGISNALAPAPKLEVYSGNTLEAETNIVSAAAADAAAHVGAFPAAKNSSAGADGDAALEGEVSAGILTAHATSSAPASGPTVTVAGATSGSVAMLEFYDAGSKPEATAAHFVNFSARSRCDAADAPMIVGFVVRGDGYVNLLLRAVGPTLASFGVADAASDPKLDLYSGSTLLASNDDWQAGGATQVRSATTAAGTFSLGSAKDAALVVSLPAGSYTLHVGSAAGQGGIVLAEIYEVPPTAKFDAATAVNGLGLDVFLQLAAKSSTDNLVISPYSIESAFGLAYVGAAGDTRAQMAQVLGFPSDNAAVVSGLDTVRASLDQAAADSIAIAKYRSSPGSTIDPITWQVANRLFGQTGFPFRDSYLSLLSDGFGAPMQAMDFIGSPDPSRIAINDWVAGVTHDRIKDLIPLGGIDTDTRMVLVNALYLKATWEKPFWATMTVPQAFHFQNGSVAEVPTMPQTDYFGYAKLNGYSVAALPYLGKQLQFVVLLPNEGESVASVASRLSTADAARWASVPPTYLALSLPKFTSDSPALSLADVLISLGMKAAFGVPPGSANFDGIAPRDAAYLQLQRVFHKTFVAVDEKGTEAAAATAIVGMTTSIGTPPPEPIEFRVDHPFLFAIQDRQTSALLFLGRIMDPR